MIGRIGLLLATIALGACWYSGQSLLDESQAVQPFAPGAYVEQPSGDSATLKMEGTGYRYSSGSTVFKLFAVPLTAAGPDVYALELVELDCDNGICNGVTADSTREFLVARPAAGGAIEVINPNGADEKGAIGAAAGGTCDDRGDCRFDTRDGFIAALVALARAKPTDSYIPVR